MREILHEGNGTETDVAVYRDVSSNYVFTRMADGSLRVDHATPDAALNLNDGIDRLLNIEKLEFGDGKQLWVTGQQATGDLTISNPNPSVGDLLRVNVANLLDGNGLAADVVITMTRQAFVNGQWRDQATGVEFRVLALFRAHRCVWSPVLTTAWVTLKPRCRHKLRQSSRAIRPRPMCQ